MIRELTGDRGATNLGRIWGFPSKPIGSIGISEQPSDIAWPNSLTFLFSFVFHSRTFNCLFQSSILGYLAIFAIQLSFFISTDRTKKNLTTLFSVTELSLQKSLPLIFRRQRALDGSFTFADQSPSWQMTRDTELKLLKTSRCSSHSLVLVPGAWPTASRWDLSVPFVLRETAALAISKTYQLWSYCDRFLSLFFDKFVISSFE